MLALISYIVALALVGLAGAQSSANTSSTNFNPNSIDLPTRLAWCRSETSLCPQICGGTDNQNNCDENTLDFSCVCSNGSNANVGLYMNTIPYYTCEATYAQCINAHPNDLTGQTNCKNAAKCGTLNATEQVNAASSSAAAASSSSAAATASSTMASTTKASSTSASTSSTTTKAASMAVKVGQDYGVGIMAAVFMAAFKLLL